MDSVDIIKTSENSSSLENSVSSLEGINKNLLDTNSKTQIPRITFKPYSQRFWILLLFSLYSMANAFQWIQYSIVTSIVSQYYNVSNLAINFTSMVYMLIYIPGILPATWLLNKKGLRLCVCLGALGTSLGSFIKCFTSSNTSFPVLMIAQCIVATSQLFIINIPPNLAAVWFPANEVSSATSFGVFGNQIGIALGFIVPPMIITNANTEDGLYKMSIVLFIITFILFLLILLTFKEKPPLPPSSAQELSQTHNSDKNYFKILKTFFRDKNFILLFLSYGINVGVFYALSTLLEQVLSIHFVKSSKEAGQIGLLITISGTIGSVISGIILDKTHLFKLTTLALYILSLAGMIIFTCSLYLSRIWIMFIVSAFLGFFMTGYLPIGFEFAAELTYPQPEGTSAGLLNMSAQIFGIFFTLLSSIILEKFGDFSSNLLLSFSLLIGSIMTLKIQNTLKRQDALGNKQDLDSDNKPHKTRV